MSTHSIPRFENIFQACALFNSQLYAITIGCIFGNYLSIKLFSLLEFASATVGPIYLQAQEVMIVYSKVIFS